MPQPPRVPPAPLPLPDLFDTGKTRQWSYATDVGALLIAARAHAAGHGIPPASRDERRTVLLLIDVQRDFCFPQGALFVAGRSGEGAMADNDRLVRFLYQNLTGITEVVCTLDTHSAHQIFFPSFWLDESGHHPCADTEITLDDVENGIYRPDPELVPLLGVPDRRWLERQVRDYCGKLEARGQLKLFLWPPHCLLGTPGHNLVGAVNEARLFHAFARRARDPLVQKSRDALTENYSALAPEVLEAFDGTPLGRRNAELIESLLAADRVVIAGQASSHCVAATVLDLLDEIGRRDASLAEKIYLLQDCMSPVVLRDPQDHDSVVVDFSFAAEAMFERASQAGAKIVSTETPMADWP